MIQRLLSTLLALVLVAYAGTAQALFLSPDPMDPTLPGVGTNRYAYSLGDPINLADPSGLVPYNPGGSTSEGYNSQDEEDENYTSWTDHDHPDYETHNYESPSGAGPLGHDRDAGYNFGVTVTGTQTGNPQVIDHQQNFFDYASGAAISADYMLYEIATLGTLGLELRALRALGATAPTVGASSILSTPQVSNRALQNIIDDLYRGVTNPSRIGNGTTADAVRNELLTGLPTGGRFHTTKAQEYVRALSNWLRRNPSAPARERLIAESLRMDLQQALGYHP